MFSLIVYFNNLSTMSAPILCAVALCVCASGCDMVPPVKMVDQTTLSEPIPVRKTTGEACNACVSVAITPTSVRGPAGMARCRCLVGFGCTNLGRGPPVGSVWAVCEPALVSGMPCGVRSGRS